MASRRNGSSDLLSIQRIVIAAMCIAIGVVLPQVFHLFPVIGQTFPNPAMIFLPMHIPVLLCGIICGIPYGILCGITVPVISHFVMGMPPSIILPAMICELAAYGLFSSLFMLIPVKNYFAKVYVGLTGAIIFGRVVYGLAQAFIFDVGNYSMQIWLISVFVEAIPGIALQYAIIPPVVMAVKKSFRNVC